MKKLNIAMPQIVSFSLHTLRQIKKVVPSSHYVLLSLLFFVGLELLTALHRWIIVMAMVMLLVLAYGILLVRYEEREANGQFSPVQLILPILAAVSLTGFTLFLPTSPLLHLYYTLAALVFYLLLKHGAKQAFPTWNWTLATIIFFLNAAVVLGLRFHLYTPILVTLGLLFASSFLIAAQALRRVIKQPARNILISLSLAISLTEVAWVLLFLPLHFLVQAGILVVGYYSIFHLLSISYERTVNKREYYEYGLISLIALLILLITASWI